MLGVILIKLLAYFYPWDLTRQSYNSYGKVKSIKVNLGIRWGAYPACMHAKLLQSCPTLCDPMYCSLLGSTVHGDFPCKNTGVGCRVLLQGIFPTQVSNPRLPHCRQILYRWATREAWAYLLCMKYIVVFSCSETLCTVRRNTYMSFNMDKSHKHDVKNKRNLQKKRTHMAWPLYINLKTRQKYYISKL